MHSVMRQTRVLVMAKQLLLFFLILEHVTLPASKKGLALTLSRSRDPWYSYTLLCVERDPAESTTLTCAGCWRFLVKDGNLACLPGHTRAVVLLRESAWSSAACWQG